MDITYQRAFSRIDRIEKQLLHELAQLICTHLKDPRIQGVVPTQISLTKDCGHAKVYYTILASNPSKTTQEALQKAAGYFRSQMSQKIRLFSVPQLHFCYDTSFEKKAAMDKLFEKIEQEKSAVTPISSL